ncbi:hypothetical protein K1719_023767 [Acacia pycnantha]|nr:hypothetical protein K1719_023767 [Acacia pycnantha]
MFSLRDFWRRHRRKFFITACAFGSGCLFYKLYDAHKRRLEAQERELTLQREREEHIKAQIQAHFKNIQMISDTITLPHAMHYLSCRIAEDLDLSELLERLIQGKGQPNTLTNSEKLELWERLKILSFTKMALSVWATTMLSLYVKVQVNILGRLLYIDTARSLGSSNLLENRDVVDREDQQKFLGSVDFLAQYGIPSLVSDMELATKEALKGKQLRDAFNSKALHEIFMQILNTFMSTGSPHSWVKYMMPEAIESRTTISSSVDSVPSDTIGLDQLMAEARAVLTSAEFGNVVETSLKAVLDTLVELMAAKFGGGNLTSVSATNARRSIFGALCLRRWM